MGQNLVACAIRDTASPPFPSASCVSLDARPALSNLSNSRATTSGGGKVRRKFAVRRPRKKEGGWEEGKVEHPSPEKYVSSNLNTARSR